MERKRNGITLDLRSCDGYAQLYRKFGNQIPNYPRNIREERRTELYRSGRLQACKIPEYFRLHVNCEYKAQIYRQLSRDILTATDLLCDKAAVFTGTTTKRKSNSYSRCQNRTRWLNGDARTPNAERRLFSSAVKLRHKTTARYMPLLNSTVRRPELRRRQHWSLQKKSGPKAGLRAPKVTIKCFVSLHPPYVTQKQSSRDLLRFFPFIVMSYKAPPFALFNVNTKQDHSSSQVLHKVSPLCRSFCVQ